jgi:acetyl esterase
MDGPAADEGGRQASRRDGPGHRHGDRCRPLAAQVLAYPPFDPDCRAASYEYDPHGFPSCAGLGEAWRAYRGRDYRPDSGAALYSTPLEAADLTGAAPTVLAVGALDPAADDVRHHAVRLAAAGVPVRFREFASLGHGAFLRPVEHLPGAGAPLADPLRGWLGASLRELFNDPTPAPRTSSGQWAEH